MAISTFEGNGQYTIRRFGVNGTTVKRFVFPSDEKERYLHVYYSYHKAAAEKEKLLPGTYNWIWDAPADLQVDTVSYNDFVYL